MDHEFLVFPCISLARKPSEQQFLIRKTAEGSGYGPGRLQVFQVKNTATGLVAF